MNWDVNTDELIVDISHLMQSMRNMEPSKRNVMSIAAKIYDPIGIISPITIRFKHFLQLMCKEQLDWNEHLKGDLLKGWKYQGAPFTITIAFIEL